MNLPKQAPVKLNNTHCSELKKLLYSDKMAYIHQVYELEHYGISTKMQRFWGLFENNQLMSVLFSENLSDGEIGYIAGDNQEFNSVMIDFGFDNGLTSIIGKESSLQSLTGSYESQDVKLTRWNVSISNPKRAIPNHDYPVRKAGLNDIDKLVDLYMDYEFGSHGSSPKILREQLNNFINNVGQFFVVEMDRKIVAGAMVYLETSFAGMIGFARVLPEYRRRHIYPSVDTACKEYLFSKGKKSIGFYVSTNIKVKRVSKNSGSKNIEDWIVLKHPRKASTTSIRKKYTE